MSLSLALAPKAGYLFTQEVAVSSHANVNVSCDPKYRLDKRQTLHTVKRVLLQYSQ